MSRLKLTDTFSLDGKIKATVDGYLAANARVARTGIQVYKGHEVGRPDMETVRVLRPASEVFNKDAMRSFAHRPVTYLHPPETVGSKNWKMYAVGHTGEDVVRDGDFIRVPMLLMDAAAIDSYQKDGVKELSMGYSTDLKWKPGKTSDGDPYDAIQTDIRGNHLAVVPVARGGDALRLGDKAGDYNPDEDEEDDSDVDDAAPYFFDACPSDYLPGGMSFMYDRDVGTKERKSLAKEGKALPGGGFPIKNKQDLDNARQAIGRAKDPSAARALIRKRAKELGVKLPDDWQDSTDNIGDRAMRTITIDGVPVEVEDKAAIYLEKHLNTLTQTIADQKGKLDKAAADDEDEEEEETKAQDAIRRAFDAKDAEVATLKKQLSDASDSKLLDARVNEKLAAAGKAKQLMGDTFITDGKTPEAIRREVVDAKMGDTAKGWSDDQVSASFASLTAVAHQPKQPAKYGDGQFTQSNQYSNDGNDKLKAAIADAASRFPNANGSLDEAQRLRDAAFDELEKRSQSAWKTKSPGAPSQH